MELSENIFLFSIVMTHLISYFQQIYLVPSKYPNPNNCRRNSITSCNKCNICKHYMLFHRTFTCAVTCKVYYIKGEMKCESTTIIYVMTCMKCLEQHAGSAIKIESRFKIHRFKILLWDC